MRQLPPLLLRDKYWRTIEDEIIRIWAEIIFRPLLRDLQKPESEIQNTGSALLEAVSGGTVWWQDGVFKGQYNAAISRALKALGATYNAPSKLLPSMARLPIQSTTPESRFRGPAAARPKAMAMVL